MKRKISLILYALFVTSVTVWAATFDYNPPPLGSSQVEQRNDLNVEYDGINSTKADLNSPTFTGTVSGITKSMVGLGSVDNTTDAGKPVSTAQQTALDLKANIASPTFTGTVAGITKSMVGLGSVDNTTDAGKPVSTAQQTALDLKANIASPTLTGNPLTPTPSTGDNDTSIASTAFVKAQAYATLASPSLTGNPLSVTPSVGDSDTSIATTAFVKTKTESFCIAVSDEATAITTGTAKVTWRMPYAFTLTNIRGSLNTVSSSGAPIIDVNDSGTTVMTTNKVLIDVSEETSVTAGTAVTLTDTSIADDAEMTADIDTAGTGAKGLKICLIGYQT